MVSTLAQHLSDHVSVATQGCLMQRTLGRLQRATDSTPTVKSSKTARQAEASQQDTTAYFTAQLA